jgi:hypothetical protein
LNEEGEEVKATRRRWAGGVSRELQKVKFVQRHGEHDDAGCETRPEDLLIRMAFAAVFAVHIQFLTFVSFGAGTCLLS